ncbi:hypothetical protein A5320_10925 [Rheinheimera sp. SA_1]|uniref:hypothetical protein n=1 Tax=Rheinheimera sp. SA_1 TaxID=1827365 RepID=UPI0007FCB499|nr:hypothetical protein [Rheinheimera sp. SA_1]OBP14297.1 hypothetical protein A5320_10925 [Rheinheimera sp. SA_1]
MDIPSFIVSALPAVLGAVGAWFLVNEVNHAHQFEEISRELNDIERLQTLSRSNPREFWLRSAMISFKCDRAKAEELASALSDADIDAAIAKNNDLWERQISAGLERWNSKTVRSQLQKRRRMLWLGFWLLMASAAAQVLFALLKLFCC